MIDAVLRAEGREAVATGRLQAIRQASLLSQSELGRALGVSQTAVALWEKGERIPRGESAEKLAQLLRDLKAVVV